MPSPTGRSDADSARLLKWRIRFFGVGAVLGLAGIFLDASWLVTAALIVLLAGFGLRFASGAAGSVSDGGASRHADEEEYRA